MERDLLLHLPLEESLQARTAGGEAGGVADTRGDAPVFHEADGRRGARFGRSCAVRYAVPGNFRREAGTLMLRFRPDWDADYEEEASLGRILWDLRIDHGSVVPDDPSQRYALVYPYPHGSRGPQTTQRWRLCLATDRNRYVIGTDRPREDRRTRQAVFGSRQTFRAGAWMHLAVTWTPEEGAIHVDGVEDARAPLPEGLPDRPLPETMTFGAIESWINAGPCGTLADVRLYGRALTSGEIAAMAAP